MGAGDSGRDPAGASRLEKCVFQKLDCQICSSHAAGPPGFWGVVTERLKPPDLQTQNSNPGTIESANQMRTRAAPPDLQTQNPNPEN